MNKGVFFMLVLVVFSILYYLIGFTGCEAAAQDKIEEVSHEYSPQDYHMNYGIDLKPDGYLINADGEIYYVPFGELEDWFLEDNL